jgi:transcriptional regulator with GAF, ATPase, and Fis domain
MEAVSRTLGGMRKVLELPRCSILVLNGELRGLSRVVEGDVFTIGKSPDSDLVLDHETVSRAHCEIVRDPKGFLLRDKDSTNGTFLDGSEIKEAYLRPGCTLGIGAIELRLQPYAERVEVLPSEREFFGEVVGRDVAMREIFGLLERFAPTDSTILLGGETGTGKDVMARAIHAASRRAAKPFVVVDCGAMVGTLIESELFGHERGAFTGAVTQRRGAFELAHGGTVFLDEIGELPLDLQPKLLRAIEQRSFRRVGGNREIRVDLRMIAASKRPLRREVERGKFREDLYFRLAVVPIELPPLRDRRQDIPLLVDKMWGQLQRQHGSAGGPQDDGVQDRKRVALSAAAVQSLMAHDWPGNVRELRNVLERAMHLAATSSHRTLGPDALPIAEWWGGGGPSSVAPSVGSSASASEAQRAPHRAPHRAWVFDPAHSYRQNKSQWESEFERRYVAWLLGRHNGNVSAAARSADMDRKYLHQLAKKHGIRPVTDDAPYSADEPEETGD